MRASTVVLVDYDRLVEQLKYLTIPLKAFLQVFEMLITDWKMEM